MNFQDLYRKIQAIDEGTSVEECGGMMSGPMSPPKQSDSVTMNVSMNGSGAGGIKDLMSILKNIEQSGGPSADDEKLFGEPGSDMGKEPVMGDDYANDASNTVTLDIDAVTPTGDDLHSKGTEAEKVNGGGNPMQPGLGESLTTRLLDMYNEIKNEAYNPNSASAENRRKLDQAEGKRLKDKAEADDATDADKARYQRYKDRKAATAAAYNREMDR